MKKIILPLLIVAIIGLLSACNNPKKSSAETQDAQKVAASDSGAVLKVDTALSVVNWAGSKIVGGGHNGTVKVKSGEIRVDGQTILGGTIVVDMTTLSSDDLKGESKGQLEGHLKSADFFDVEKYPEASFEITSSELNTDATYSVSGNLKIKDVAKNITVKASVNKNGNIYSASIPTFVIDRTEWGVVYGSKKITDKAKDAVIKDQIEFQVAITAQ